MNHLIDKLSKLQVEIDINEKSYRNIMNFHRNTLNFDKVIKIVGVLALLFGLKESWNLLNNSYF